MTSASQLKNIVLVCSRLDLPGGVERTIVNTANLLQSKGHKVSIIVTDSCEKIFYSLREDIHLRQITLDFGITSHGNMLTRKINFFRHVKKLQQIFLSLEPQVIIGTEYPLSIASYLAGRRLGVRIYAWEHHHFHWLHKNRFWNYLQEKIYPRLKAVVCLNDIEKHLFESHKCRTLVIPNFVERQAKNSLKTKELLSIGWLIERKGIDLLPSIASLVLTKYPDWHWTIIGSGPLEESLKKAILQKDLAENITILPPSTAELSNLYSNVSVFVMTSRFECFPMVLLESLAHGIPAVSFNCPTGPSFIIKNGEDGILVENGNIESMSEGIISLIADDQKRSDYGNKAHQNILRFSAESIYTKWEKLLLEE